jgi:hypothetical protein
VKHSQERPTEDVPPPIEAGGRLSRGRPRGLMCVAGMEGCHLVRERLEVGKRSDCEEALKPEVGRVNILGKAAV